MICQIKSNLQLYENDPLVQLVILKVSLMNGIVMGGGAGLSMPTTFRVVTEKAGNI
ncbi:Enoyl-CoA hydratase/isomerase [Vigna unguiculata]|uniref:3-hydroxyisobutyryl-CoA hydrolase n=1 Tax=Vigna unguiculata TaxID=3917 RepID=A0A4D6MBV2_VIGUN|nr:Enoyl-CoA hydratase/isomerase [Vigna unguiculata]